MIVVDPALHPFRGKLCCHMASDDVSARGIAELHIAAKRLGLRVDWYQDKDLPHYDLFPSVRLRAVAAGAREITIPECATLIGKWRAWKLEHANG